MSTISDSAMDTHIPEKEESILCRLCLNTCRSAVNIFSEGEGLRLCEIINEIMQLDVSMDEGLPETVCEGCCGKVRDFKDFKSMCVESRRELVSRLCGTRNQGEVIKACTSKSPCSTTTNAMCTPSESVVGEGKRENCLEGIPGTPSAVEGAASNCVEGEAEGMAKSLEERKGGCSPATADDWASESEESQDQPSSDEDSLPSRILRSRKRQQRRNLRSLRNTAVKDGYVEPKFVPGYVLARELLYECPFCGRIYETKRGLTHHLSTIHDQPMAQCSKKSRKTDVLPLKPSVTKDLDPLSAKWGLKECSVVLTDVFPGGVGDTKPNPLALGGVRNTETSDLRKVRIDRNGVVNVNGVACDDGSGKTGGDEDCGSDLGFGECGRTSSRGSVCDKHSVMSCGECSGHEGEGSALRDEGRVQCEPSSEAPSDGDCRTSPRKTNDATLGRVKTENDQRSDNYTNPFFGRCIMILDEADDESRDASSACSRTDGQSAVRKVPEDKTCTSNSATTWMVCDQSPGCSRDGETSSMDCEMDPLMLEESSCSEVEESGGEGGETDSLAGSCARAQVWPHLILRQKHDIETLSDISDDDDRGEAIEQQLIPPTEDSQEEIIVEAVVHRGASSVEPLPIRVESTSSLSRWETVDDHPEKSSPAPTTSYVDNLTRLHQYLVNPSSYNIQHPSLACSVCGVECQDKPQLDVHILMMHTGPPRIGCSVCGAQCRNETELDEHMRSMHEQPQRFVCSMCSWTFARESLLMQHVSFHCKDGGFMCLVCRAMHATGEELLRHTKYVHAGLAQHRGLEEGKGDEMRAKGLYKEVVNNPLPPYVMSDIVSSHLVPSTVQERVETLQWQQVNPPPCQDTNNAFNALAPVDQEMIQVESVGQGQVVYDTRTNGCYTLSTGNEKKYVCKFCSLETRHKSSLYRHILRQHVGGKRMSCAHCQRTFSNSENLVAHQKLHSEEWPYRCTLCVKVFKTSRYLKRHMVIHAKEASVAAAWAGGGDGQQATNKGLLMWFACTLCGRAYQNKASLKEHFKVEHGNFNLFECAHCGQRFADYGLLCDHSKICGAVGEPCNKEGGVMVEPAA